MKASLILGAAGVFATLLTATSYAGTAAAPQRKLVFAFTYGATQSVQVHNSGFDGTGNATGAAGSGVDSYSNHASATGTIDVSVTGEQPDKGLVLSVSEDADNAQRNAKPATCVVYGNGSVICDPNATVNPEEYSIIRFLGVNFVDPSLLDAKGHWQIANNGPDFSATNDYALGKTDGSVMSITEDRKVSYTGARSGIAAINTSITYDYARKVPLAIDEQTSSHPAGGGGHDVDMTVTVTAKLQNDSMASTAKPGSGS
jgi:hypothetical protein